MVHLKKIRMNYINSNRTSLTNNEDYKILTQQELLIQPRFGEFQLIGDGLLVCFADKILQQPHRIINGARTVGYCVNGQKIDQLRQRIKLKTYPLSTKVMVLIGTNDVLCHGYIATMRKHFNALLNLLKKSVEKVLILTLPPIPKLCVTYYHWNLIRQYNAFLKSLDNGRSIRVADICPLFTKLMWVLEYKMDITGKPENKRIISTESRKTPRTRRRKYFSTKRNNFSVVEGKYQNISDKSESDYRYTSDTNTSLDSDILSSELSQEKESLQSAARKQGAMEAYDIEVKLENDKVLKSSEKNNYSATRYVLKTFQSVFGMDVLRLRQKTGEEKLKTNSPEQPEKRPKKSPIDLNESLHGMDSWQVESDEDSMNGHVYKSQEEIEYDVIDVSGSETKKKQENGLFSKFVESCNVNEVVEARENQRKKYELFSKSCCDNEAPTRRTFSYGRLKRDSFLNEKPDETESSSSSDVASPKKQIYPYIDDDFRYFVVKQTLGLGETDCSLKNSATRIYCLPGKPRSHSLRSPYDSLSFIQSNVALLPTPPTMPESPVWRHRNYNEQCFKKIDGISETTKLILQLANKICHMEYYELFFYSCGKKKIDMIHLNYYGLIELKNFLVTNKYVQL